MSAQGRSLTDLWRSLTRSTRVAQLAGIFALAIVFFCDMNLPSNIMVPMLYCAAVVVVSFGRDRRLLWATAALAVGCIVITIFYGQPPTYPQARFSLTINRTIASSTILLVTLMIHLRLVAEDARNEQHAMLQEQNVALEGLNRELAAREAEILRQNQALHSQTLQLETRSAELREMNLELLQGEHTLAELLTLSRALTADLNREDALSRICETVVALLQAQAAAILEVQDGVTTIVSHWGFGPAGPTTTHLPTPSTLAARTMRSGGTANVEDVRQNPGLMLPSPTNGPMFLSALSAPLVNKGRAVGAIEVYSLDPRGWNATQKAILQSLAAQAMTSMQSAELVEAIRQERRRFETIVSNAPIGVAVAEDPECLRVRLNRAGAAMLGVAVDENTSPYTENGALMMRRGTINGQPLDAERAPMLRAARGEVVQGEEVEFVFDSGRRLSLLISAVPITNADGTILGAMTAFVDVTLQKSLQRDLEIRRREAEEANLRKTRFLAAVSHDIRTPANAISLLAELVRRFASEPSRHHELSALAADLQRNTISLTELIGDVLDLARFDSGEVERNETVFSLEELIDQECRQLAPLANEKNLRLLIDPLPRNVRLRTDRVKLRRILSNLVGNAIKFTESGSVRVSVELNESAERPVLVRVHDTGIGIDRANLATIFDEFEQLHNPARDRAKGVGLGLAICRRLVELLDGQITVESRLSEGSIFTLSLPASSLMQEPAPVADASERGERALLPPSVQVKLGMRLLLVEDHESTRECTARILREEGAEVLEAATGRAAIELLASEPIDVLLLDMMLPDIDGREVLKFLQSHSEVSLQAVYAMTGDLTVERRNEIKALGADGLIEKPIDLPRLIRALRMIQFLEHTAGPQSRRG